MLAPLLKPKALLAGWELPNAGVDAPPNRLGVLPAEEKLPKRLGVLAAPSVGAEPNMLGVLAAPKAGALPPKAGVFPPPNRLGVLTGAPKAGVLVPPNMLGLELDEAPKLNAMLNLYMSQNLKLTIISYVHLATKR